MGERSGAPQSVPGRSGRQFRLQFGRFGGPISGRKAAGPAGRPADLGLRTRPGRPGAFRSVPERSGRQFRLQFGRFGAPNPAGAFRSVPERSGGQFLLQFGRFGGPISGRSVPAGPALGNRPIWGSKTMTPMRYS